MLVRLRRHAAAAGVGSSGALEVVEADLLDLELPGAGTYRLAIIALNSLFLLATRDGQRQAFRTIASHLAPGGVAAVDVWLPDADDLARFERTLLALWEAIERARAERDFRPKPSRLCGWCSHQALCPAYGGTPPPYPEEVTNPNTAPLDDRTAGRDE